VRPACRDKEHFARALGACEGLNGVLDFSHVCSCCRWSKTDVAVCFRIYDDVLRTKVRQRGEQLPLFLAVNQCVECIRVGVERRPRPTAAKIEPSERPLTISMISRVGFSQTYRVFSSLFSLSQLNSWSVNKLGSRMSAFSDGSVWADDLPNKYDRSDELLLSSCMRAMNAAKVSFRLSFPT
jgi:hypothetical protein